MGRNTNFLVNDITNFISPPSLLRLPFVVCYFVIVFCFRCVLCFVMSRLPLRTDRLPDPDPSGFYQRVIRELVILGSRSQKRRFSCSLRLLYVTPQISGIERKKGGSSSTHVYPFSPSLPIPILMFLLLLSVFLLPNSEFRVAFLSLLAAQLKKTQK